MQLWDQNVAKLIRVSGDFTTFVQGNTPENPIDYIRIRVVVGNDYSNQNWNSSIIGRNYVTDVGLYRAQARLKSLARKLGLIQPY